MWKSGNKYNKGDKKYYRQALDKSVTYNMRERKESVDMQKKTPQEMKNESNFLTYLSADNFDIRLFNKQFKDNSAKALMEVLRYQDNADPLKKGGEGIAFRCDTLLLKNRQNYTVAENTVFDILFGYVSSHPEDEDYIIYAADVRKYTRYQDNSYIYKVLHDGIEGLKSKQLQFEIINQKGQSIVVAAPWYQVLTYTKDFETGRPFISFVPSDLFKALLLSATITHGAYYKISISTQISARYPRNFYYYLEAMKNHREYPDAPKGKFYISLDDIYMITHAPKSYRVVDINKRVIDKTKEILDEIEECPFTFEYIAKKERSTGVRSKTVGYYITIKDKVTEVETAVNHDLEIHFLEAQDFSKKEIEKIIREYERNNRDFKFLTAAFVKLSIMEGVKNRCSYLSWMMENGIPTGKVIIDKKNSFNNFDQREYDFDELETMLLNATG